VLGSQDRQRGVLTRVAGSARFGYSGDGGPATGAELSDARALAVDTGGSLYIADKSNNVIRKVAADGTITTVAGNGTAGYSGDGGPATGAQLDSPSGVAADSGGNLYIADTDNDVIRKVTPEGTITTFAQGFSTRLA